MTNFVLDNTGNKCYSSEELHLLFDLETLQLMYRLYIDDDKSVSITKKSTLVHVLQGKVGISTPHVKDIEEHDIVLDLRGNYYRVIKVDSKDDRVNNCPLLFDLQVGSSKIFTSYLIKVQPFVFDESVDKKYRQQLYEKAELYNYFKLGDKYSTIGRINVFSNEFAKDLINAEATYSMPNDNEICKGFDEDIKWKNY